MKHLDSHPAKQQKESFEHFLYMAQVVELRDPYTAGHLWRVAQLTKMLGKEVGLDGIDLFNVTLGAYLHDFGKVVVPDQILNKTTDLNNYESRIMQTHAEAGFQALGKHKLTSHVAFLARYHHEHWDGKGYPNMLKGEEIPFGARLVGIADAFDAMTSNRPYSRSKSLDRTMAIIKKDNGSQFDPEIVQAFLQLEEEQLQHITGHSDTNLSLLDCMVCGPVIEAPDEGVDFAYCRVCTGKFNVHRSSDGKVELEFDGDHAEPIELLSKPNMHHIDSNFAEFGL